MPVDPSVFNNIKTYQDYKNQQDAVDLQRAQVGAALQGASVDTLTKQNVLKGQYLSAAAGTGDQATWDATRQKLGVLGIDVSDVPQDVTTGNQYANSLKIAQSPYGALINGGKAISDMTGTIPPVLSNLINGVSAKLPTPSITSAGNTSADTNAPAVAASDLSNDPTIARAVSGNNQVSPPVGPTIQRQPNETIAAQKLRLENDPSVIQAQEEAKKQADVNVKRGDSALGSKDILRLYNKLGSNAQNVPGGVIGNLGADISNAVNAPTQGAINRGTYDADLNNLYLATIRSMAATGRVMKGEIDNIKSAAPQPGDSTGVKIAKTNAHLEDYNQRMMDMGFDPSTGQKLNPGQQGTPVPQVPNPYLNNPDSSQGDSQAAPAYKAGSIHTSPTGTYLFNGGDPTDKNNYKRIKGPQ